MRRLTILIFSFFNVLIFTTSCEDFFKQESDDVLYADKEHLNNAVDTIYSVTGILNKLQVLADRTILLGEVRGDLVDLTSVASNDLRELANFSVSDDNKYNTPSDYYAVINNCNYFIAHADTSLKSNRNEDIFMKEYCAVKAIRAWTYLQLALNYGRVPFFTEPLLTKEAAEAAEKGTQADLQTVCDYFINDLSALPERYNVEFPGYRTIRNTESALFWFPLSIMRGELYLWRACVTKNKEDYKQAALNYYKYISERNGENSAYPTGVTYYMWTPGSSTWLSTTGMISGSFFGTTESKTANGELITMIPGDSIRAEGNYSELRNIFVSREENDYKVSATPSARLFEISASQVNCCLSANGQSVIYAPAGLDQNRSGDLRLAYYYSERDRVDHITNERYKDQDIDKFSSRNVHIWRRMMVYMHMAEALNMAGYPHMAFKILSEGLTTKLINNEVMPYYHYRDTLGNTTTLADSLFLAQFDFPDTRYGIVTADDIVDNLTATHNMLGIHSRGCGYTPMNEYYVMPNDTVETDDTKRAQLIEEHKVFVDSLLLNESALEFAFEGMRFYDIMRYALRQQNPGATMQKIVGARKGLGKNAEITTSLTDQRNWYMKWNGKIGFIGE